MRYILLLFAVSSLSAKDLVVHLPVESVSPKTVFLAQLSSTNKEYKEFVYNILHQDIIFNGLSQMAPHSAECQERAVHKDQTFAFQVNFWKKKHIDCVIVPTIKGKELSVQLFDVRTAALKTLYPIELRESRSLDCTSLHKLSDSIHQILYKEPGCTSKRILYAFQPDAEDETTWQSELYETDYAGNYHRQVTTDNHYSISPAFFPLSDAENYQFLYVTYKQGQPRIYRSSKAESRGYPFIPLRGNQLLPAIRPDGKQIAFISDASGRADLFVQNVHPDKGLIGKPQQVYTHPGAVQASPTYDPSGKRIAFASDKNGTSQIFVLNVDGQTSSTPQVDCITTEFKDNTGPSWSADGKKIAYSAKINGVRQICLYDYASKTETALTSGPGNKENPRWSQDNRRIVYNTTSPNYDVYLLDTENKTSRMLTTNRGKSHYPAWQP